MDTTGEKKKRTSKKTVYGRSTSSHDSRKFRTKSMEKQGWMDGWIDKVLCIEGFISIVAYCIDLAGMAHTCIKLLKPTGYVMHQHV
jgi:hypothetical protein